MTIRLTVLTLSLVLFTSLNVRAADAPTNIVCTKAGKEGSKVTVSVTVSSWVSTNNKVEVDSDVITRTDISDEPSRVRQKLVYSPNPLVLETDENGNRQVTGKINKHGTCLGSCGVTLFNLNITPANVGTYSLIDSNFSESEGKTVNKTIQTVTQMSCVVTGERQAKELQLDGFIDKLFGNAQFTELLNVDVRKGQSIDLTFSKFELVDLTDAATLNDRYAPHTYSLTLDVKQDMGDAFRSLGTIAAEFQSNPRSGLGVTQVKFTPRIK